MDKSKFVAYMLWFWLGFFSMHRIYIGKPWVLRFFTFQFITIGWFIDFFTLRGMVNEANATSVVSPSQSQQQSQSIVVNVMGATPTPTSDTPEDTTTKE